MTTGNVFGRLINLNGTFNSTSNGISGTSLNKIPKGNQIFKMNFKNYKIKQQFG
jgi:hypothetical protein